MAGCYVSRKELLGSIKRRKPHNHLRNHLAVKKDSVPWSQLMDAENVNLNWPVFRIIRAIIFQLITWAQTIHTYIHTYTHLNTSKETIHRNWAQLF